jgi:serine/threonine-protein kinase HipA
MRRCLYCYKEVAEGDFHPACSRKIFGSTIPPELTFAEKEVEELADKIIKSHATVTGVQPKLSLNIERHGTKGGKFTIVGLWGGYILKPPTSRYPQLPEVEDLTMHLATIAKIDVVPHSLIRLASGELAYITRRIDRGKKTKLHMEDMCQLTERLTEHKYHGSYEQIGKIILKYSANPGLDLVNFCELVVFSFLTGNADMHLKNFSLIYRPEVGYVFAPAYDLVATALVNPLDDEDLALTLNGKKKELKTADFIAAFSTLKIDQRQQENIFNKMKKVRDDWMEFINTSFLTKENQAALKELIKERFSRLF